MRKHAPTPELIGAIRRCADMKLSATEAADNLTTREHPLSRSAVLGIARRNGIKFTSKKQGTRTPTVRAQNPRHAPRTYTPHVVSPKSDWIAKPPRAGCSWAGCQCVVEPGDMFCFSHGKRELFA